MGEETLIRDDPVPLSPRSDPKAKSDDLEKCPTDFFSSSTSDSSSSDESDKTADAADDHHPNGGGPEGELNQENAPSLLHPLVHLPKPEAPQALQSPPPIERSASVSADSDPLATFGKFLRHRSSSLSSAITKHLSAFAPDPVTEIHLSGVKVIVTPKQNPDSDDDGSRNPSGLEQIKGRISFFSRSGCRDSTAVRSFLRERRLPYVEINIDVFPEREKELVDRAGSSAVPAIFLNEKLLGGLVALNSLRNSGEFDKRVREMAGRRCPETAPWVPVYGFDDEEEIRRRKVDPAVAILRVLRQKLPIRDRLVKMKIVRNCFSGSEMVEAIIHEADCGRKKAVEIGKELARKHFIHHVFRENDFEDGHNQFYRFLEYNPAISKCFNFRGATNDDEPKSASFVCQRITKLMTAILEAYASDDRKHLDYTRIAASEEFRRYVNLVQDLQRVDISTMSVDETMAFFLNLYNAMAIHEVIRVGKPGVIDRRAFFNDFQYIVGGYFYSLSTIKNGILRSNRKEPYSFIKPFSAGDKRLEVAVPKVNPLIHFGLCNGAQSSPTVRFFSAQGVELELRYAAREFFLNGGIEIDLNKRTVYLTRIIKWYDADFGQEKEMLKWILSYLDAATAGLLTHLLNDGGPVNVSYQSFDWSLNS